MLLKEGEINKSIILFLDFCIENNYFQLGTIT